MEGVRSPDGLSLPIQNTIIINIIWYYFIRNGKKFNEIQLTKNEMDLSNRIMKNNPPSPANKVLVIKRYNALID